MNIYQESNNQWLKNINTSWSLFLDRDGVINDEFENGYVLNWSMFQFLNGVLNALPILSAKFSHIFIVTNQKGVGKHLMSIDDLETIHHHMLIEIRKNGGRIDKIYKCTDIDETAACRKPNIGMAIQAKDDFPMIELTNSIMVGNTISDMEFGKKAGMKTILIHSKKNISDIPHYYIDAQFSGLEEFAKAL